MIRILNFISHKLRGPGYAQLRARCSSLIKLTSLLSPQLLICWCILKVLSWMISRARFIISIINQYCKVNLKIRSIKTGDKEIKFVKVRTGSAQRRFPKICRCQIRESLRVGANKIRMGDFSMGKVFRSCLGRINFKHKVCWPWLVLQVAIRQVTD